METVSTRRPEPDGRRIVASAAGAVGAAFLASLCCLGPLVFAALGIGGAGLLVRFVPYRPYFTALTLALLGAGFYFSYRRPRVAAAAEGPACACEHPKANRFGRMMLRSRSRSRA